MKGKIILPGAKSAYIYKAYASDADGTGFTLISNPALRFVADLKSTVEIPVPVAADFAGLWYPIDAYAGMVDDIAFEFCDVVAGTAKTYTLDIKASFGYTIESASLETDNGTLTGVSVKIGVTNVTSLSSLTVDTAVDTTDASGAKTVIIGDRVTISTSAGYTGFPTLIRGKIKIKRT